MLFKNYDNLVMNGLSPVIKQRRKDILDILSAAVEAVQPSRVIKDLFHGSKLVFASKFIDLASFNHIYIVGFGKASVGMAQAVCDAVPVTKGVVITNDSSVKIKNRSIEVIVGGHPLPNDDSIYGAEKIIDLLSKCNKDDCVFVLISGGGSSLFCKPRVPIDDLQRTVEMLLRSGVNIEEFNTIRKHLSFVKGGQLVRYTKAVVVSLVISDVVHNPIGSIASGPTSPDRSTFSDAKKIFKQYHLWTKIPVSVRRVITEGIAGRISETLKENDSVFKTVFNFIIATNEQACQGAIIKAKELGYDVTLMSTSITGEARVVGKYFINRAKKYLSNRKTALIISGETTVTVTGNGTGGRNQEFVLSCVEKIADNDFVLASFATDGIDGNSDAAGALADGFTLTRALTINIKPSCYLNENNSYNFFKKLGDNLVTGPTGTNVMDIQILIK